MQFVKYSQDEAAETFPQCRTMYQVMNEFEKNISKSDDVLCEIIVDGNSLNIEEIELLSSMSIDRVSSIIFKTVKVDELALATLDTLNELTVLNLAKIESILPALRTEGVAGCSGDFQELLQSCQWMMEALSLLEARFTDKPQFDQTRWNEYQQLTNVIVNSMLESMANQDMVNLTDSVEYELTDILVKWQGLIKDLKK